MVPGNTEMDTLKQPSSARPSGPERKKRVPWTEDEHRLFLMGLQKYGKGDWRNISRCYVISRTPTQVASHAQKYFIRQLSGGKDKRRSSIHNITTVNLTDTRTPSPENNKPPSSDQSTLLLLQPNSVDMPKTLFDLNQPNNVSAMVFSPTHGNLFMPPPYVITNYGFKMQGQNLHKGALHGMCRDHPLHEMGRDILLDSVDSAVLKTRKIKDLLKHVWQRLKAFLQFARHICGERNAFPSYETVEKDGQLYV